jgi:tRNA dimethylallyltransferase
VLRLTGQAFSAQRAAWTTAGAATLRCFALARTREDLRARIEARVDAMFAAGLVAETRDLLARGLGANRTAMQAIGYRQVVEHLRGLRGFGETVELVKQKTWQFARRQLTWLRHQLPVRWIEVGPDETPEVTARRLPV